MGIFSILTPLITNALPKVINIVKYAGQGIADGISKNGLAGYRLELDPSPKQSGYRAGQRFALDSLDGPINEEESSQEQVLQQHAGALKSEVIAGLIATKEMNNAVLLNGLVNCKADDVILEASPSFYYSKSANPGSYKDGVPVIGINDHAYTHIIPKLFKNYDKLKKYDAFCLQHIEVASTQLTTDITGTTVSFYPLTKDTRKLENYVIKSAYNSQESSAFGRIAYLIRNVTPGTFTIKKGGFKRDQFMVLPNGAIATSFLDVYDAVDTDTDGSFLSYGTLCFVKENLGDNDVAMQFSIKLHFTCYKEQYLEDSYMDDDSDDPICPDPGCAPTATTCRDESEEEEEEKSVVSNCFPKTRKFKKRG